MLVIKKAQNILIHLEKIKRDMEYIFNLNPDRDNKENHLIIYNKIKDLIDNYDTYKIKEFIDDKKEFMKNVKEKKDKVRKTGLVFKYDNKFNIRRKEGETSREYTNRYYREYYKAKKKKKD